MPDEGTQAPATEPVEDQPTTQHEVTEAPPEGTSAGTQPQEDSFTNFRLEDVPDDYREHVEKAYKQLQADYTKKRQSESEAVKRAEAALGFVSRLESEDERADALKQIAEAFGEKAVLEALGYETEDETPTPGPDPDAPLTRREWEEWQQAQEAERQQKAAAESEEAQLAAIDEHVTNEIKALGDLTAEEEQLVVGHALANLPPDENGMPQIRKAHQALQAMWDARQKQWAGSKATPQTIAGGQGASQVPDLDNAQDRRRWLKEQAALRSQGPDAA